MTGEVVESRPGGGAAAVVFLLAAAGFGAWAAAEWWAGPAVFAVLPLALAAAAVLGREPEVRFEVTADGLAFETPDHRLVRYDEVCGLTGLRRKGRDRFAIQVYHPEGVIRIPPRLTVSSRELYDFLLARLPPPPAPAPDDVPRPLRGFLAEQLGLFGPGKVFVYRARPHPPANPHRRPVAYSLAVMTAGLVWFAAGVVLEETSRSGGGWIGSGLALAVAGLVAAVALARRGAGRVRDWQDSCLVVGPGGLALLQGPLRGKMGWDELRAVEYPAKPRYTLSTTGAAGGIGLLVEGAYLVVADYYDRPLAQIAARLRGYWGGREGN
jgi:hypothetical protein